MKTTDMHELNRILGELTSKDLVLDVRTVEEYEEGHVPGSRNIPLDQVISHAEDLKKYERIFLHCRSGKRAQMATAALKEAGLNNIICIGTSGMMDWVASGYPLSIPK